jgi:hypothetical protein
MPLHAPLNTMLGRGSLTRDGGADEGFPTAARDVAFRRAPSAPYLVERGCAGHGEIRYTKQ